MGKMDGESPRKNRKKKFAEPFCGKAKGDADKK